MKILRLLLIVLPLFLVVGCSDPGDQPQLNTAEKIRIGYTPLIYGQPSYVAIDRGLLNQQEIDFELIRFENSTQALNAVITGDLDFLAVVPVLSILAAESNSTAADPLFKILYYNLDSKENPISFLMTNSSNPNSIYEFESPRVGVFPGNILSRISIELLLENEGLDTSTISFVDVAPQLQSQTIEANGVDFMLTLEPFATLTEFSGVGKIIFNAPQTSITSPIAGGAGVFSASFVKKNPLLAKAFADTIVQAMAYIRDNEEEAKAVYPNYTPLNIEIASKVRQPDYHVLKEISPTLISEQIKVLTDKGVLQNHVAAEDIIYEN